MESKNILVIKHGALGDIILSGGAMKKIRDFHKKDSLFCLTTRPYFDLLKDSPWFDKVLIDKKPKWKNLLGWLELNKELKKYDFSRIYDLQTSDRSSLNYYLFYSYKPIEWSGIAIGANFRHKGDQRKKMHTIDRQKEQLNIANIGTTGLPNWKWLIKKPKKEYVFKEKYVLIVPGTSSHRNNKKWPLEYYSELTKKLGLSNIRSVFVGLEREKDEINRIIMQGSELEKMATNLAGETSYEDLAFLANYAFCVIGNDTGPVHLAASCGANVIVLFGKGSDPKLCAPVGNKVSILKSEDIKYISVKTVLEIVKKY